MTTAPKTPEDAARRGWGWEDLRARFCLPRIEARSLVFGKAAARRMEERDMGLSVPWRLETTTRVKAREVS